MGSSVDDQCQYTGCTKSETYMGFCDQHAQKCALCRAMRGEHALTYNNRLSRWECCDHGACDKRAVGISMAALEAKQAGDFEGKIDGSGVKGSMKKLKLALNLIPPLFIQMIALVLGFGAHKYAPGNWLKGMSWSTVLEGVKRHIMAFEMGEEIDKESGLPHLAHAACGIMFLIWYAYGPDRKAYRNPKLDDRQWAPKFTDGSEFPEFSVDAELERISNLEVPKVSP